jgi:hypothetical protein
MVMLETLLVAQVAIVNLVHKFYVQDIVLMDTRRERMVAQLVLVMMLLHALL